MMRMTSEIVPVPFLAQQNPPPSMEKNSGSATFKRNGYRQLASQDDMQVRILSAQKGVVMHQVSSAVAVVICDAGNLLD
jgi:hypothetical protein